MYLTIELLLCMHVCMLSHFSHIQVFATLWTEACQTPLPMGSSQGYWWVAMLYSRESSRLKDRACISYVPVFAGGFYTTSATWKAHVYR